MKIKRILFLIILIIICFFIPVYAQNHGGDLNIKRNKRPFNLNPIYAANETELLIVDLIFDKLIEYNAEGEVVPNLAKSWEINSNSDRIIFNLKTDVYFHNYNIKKNNMDLESRKVKAEDWKWSLEYLADPKNKSPYANIMKRVKGYEEYKNGESQKISGIKVLNDYQLEVVLKDSYAPFIYNFLESSMVVMPKEIINQSNYNFSLSPIGTGPFKFNDLSANNIKLVKNNNFWLNNYQNKKLPYLDQIIIDFGAKSNDDFKNYDLYQLNSKEFQNYLNKNKTYIDKDYLLKRVLDENIYILAFETELQLKNNKNNIKNLITEKVKNESKTTFGINQSILAANLFSEGYNLINKIYNLDKKNENTFFTEEKINITVNDKIITENNIINIKNGFKQFNLELMLSRNSWIEHLNFLKNNKNKDFFIYPYKYTNSFNFIYDNFYSSSKLNYSNYKNDRLDKMVKYLILESKQSNVKQASEVIVDILSQNNPTAVIYQGNKTYLVSNKLNNLDILENIYLKNKYEVFYLDK